MLLSDVTPIDAAPSVELKSPKTPGDEQLVLDGLRCLGNKLPKPAWCVFASFPPQERLRAGRSHHAVISELHFADVPRRDQGTDTESLQNHATGESTMMSLAALVVAATVVTAEPQIEASEPQFDAAREQIRALEPLVGEWYWDEFTAPQDIADINAKKGDKFKRIRTFKLDLVSSILVADVVIENAAGRRQVVAKSISGWDAASEKLVGMSFWAGPLAEWYAGKLEWSAAGNTVTLKATGSLNKDKALMRQDLILEGDDTLIIKTLRSTLNGKPVPNSKTTTRLKRIK